MDMHIFTELVGIQMLLMNTLEPLLRGDKLAREQLSVLFRQVQTTQAAKAQELLAKRSRNKEKDPCQPSNSGAAENRSSGRPAIIFTPSARSLSRWWRPDSLFTSVFNLAFRRSNATTCRTISAPRWQALRTPVATINCFTFPIANHLPELRFPATLSQERPRSPRVVRCRLCFPLKRGGKVLACCSVSNRTAIRTRFSTVGSVIGFMRRLLSPSSSRCH